MRFSRPRPRAARATATGASQRAVSPAVGAMSSEPAGIAPTCSAASPHASARAPAVMLASSPQSHAVVTGAPPDALYEAIDWRSARSRDAGVVSPMSVRANRTTPPASTTSSARRS